MGHREPLRGGVEYDALTKWKRYSRWRPGERKEIKRRHNKRIRKELKRAVDTPV